MRSFPFDIEKATQVACAFMEKEGGEINHMKLVKLIYLLDRESIDQRGVPVVGGAYFSMKNGPVPSEVLDLINSGRIWDDESTSWQDHITDRANHLVSVFAPSGRDALSDSEIELIDSVYEAHGEKDEWALVHWCHRNVGEWSPCESGRKSITIKGIARALEKSQDETEALADSAAELRFVQNAIR